jgi:hypothetical protein
VSARAYAGTAPARRRPPARRPAARRRPAPRRGPSKVKWDRVGRIALTLVLAAILFSYLNPLVNFIHAYRGSSAERVQLHKLQAENALLHRKMKAADNPSVLETEARRQGLIGPGERAYVIHGLHSGNG